MKNLTPIQIRENIEAMRQQGASQDELMEYSASIGKERGNEAYQRLKGFIKKDAPVIAGDVAGEVAGRTAGGYAGGALGAAMAGPPGAVVGMAVGQEAGGALGSAIGAGSGSYASDSLNTDLSPEEKKSRAVESGLISGVTTGAIGVLGQGLGQLAKSGKVQQAVEKAQGLAEDVTKTVKESVIFNNAIKQTEQFLERVENKRILVKKNSEVLTNELKGTLKKVLDNPRFSKFKPQFKEAEKMDSLLEDMSAMKQDLAEKSSLSTKTAKQVFQQDYTDFFRDYGGNTVPVEGEMEAIRSLAEDANSKGITAQLKGLADDTRAGEPLTVSEKRKALIDMGTRDEGAIDMMIGKALKKEGFSDEQVAGMLGGATEIPVEDAHRLKQAVDAIASQVFNSSAKASDKHVIGTGLKSVKESLVKKIDQSAGNTGVYKKMSQNWSDLLDVENMSERYVGEYGIGRLKNLRSGSGEVVDNIIRLSRDPAMEISDIASKKVFALKNQVELMKESGNPYLKEAAMEMESGIMNLEKNVKSQESIKENLSVIKSQASIEEKKAVDEIEKNIHRYQKVLPSRIDYRDWADRHAGLAIASVLPKDSGLDSIVKAYVNTRFLKKVIGSAVGIPGELYYEGIHKPVKSLVNKKLGGKVSIKSSKVLNTLRAYIDSELSERRSSELDYDDETSEDDLSRMEY